MVIYRIFSTLYEVFKGGMRYFTLAYTVPNRYLKSGTGTLQQSKGVHGCSSVVKISHRQFKRLHHHLYGGNKHRYTTVANRAVRPTLLRQTNLTAHRKASADFFGVWSRFCYRFAMGSGVGVSHKDCSLCSSLS